MGHSESPHLQGRDSCAADLLEHNTAAAVAAGGFDCTSSFGSGGLHMKHPRHCQHKPAFPQLLVPAIGCPSRAGDSHTWVQTHSIAPTTVSAEQLSPSMHAHSATHRSGLDCAVSPSTTSRNASLQLVQTAAALCICMDGESQQMPHQLRQQQAGQGSSCCCSPARVEQYYCLAAAACPSSSQSHSPPGWPSLH